MTNVKHDLFPSFVIFTAPDEETPVDKLTSAPPNPRKAKTFDKARVVISNNQIVVAVDGDKGPNILFRESFETENFVKSTDASVDSYVTTNTGIKIAYRKNTACGCGSRLRSWNPYTTMNSTADPTE
jgi:hypothetical protein